MRGHIVFGLAVALAQVAPAAAYDRLGGGSFPEAHLPGVCCLEPLPDGFVATLCGLYAREYVGVDESIRGEPAPPTGPSRPRVEFRANTGWRWLDPVAPTAECEYRRPGRLFDAVPWFPGRPAGLPVCPEELAAGLPFVSQADARRLRRDLDGAEAGGKEAAGGCLAHGGYVWFGIAFYDGEGVTGVAIIGDTLWIASDGGLSRRRAGGRWEHIAFRIGETSAVEATTCRREWERARATVSRRYQAGFDEHVKAYRRQAAGAARSR